MQHWWQPLPGWWLPNDAVWDFFRWPDFTEADYTRALEELPDPASLIRALDFGRADSRAWASWLAAFNTDRPLRFDWAFHGPVADRLYETARYKFLVPAWRRAIIGVVQELDDIEDQISTLLWILETVTRKFIPIPPTIMNQAQRLQRSLDCAEKMIAGITPFRLAKHEHAS